MLESFIAAVTIAAIGSVVAYGLRRIEGAQLAASTALQNTLAQFKRDIDAVAGALHMHRGPDGNLLSNGRRRR